MQKDCRYIRKIKNLKIQEQGLNRQVEQVIKIFTQIIGEEVANKPVEDEIIEQITPKMLEKLYTVSQKHDLAHIVAAFLQKHSLLEEGVLANKFTQSFYAAVMRYENIQYEFERICELFDSEQIIYIPLKGSEIRKFYPEPWLRTSCDIDILIHPEDLEQACELLSSRFEYRKEPCVYKDVSLYSPSGVHLELHFMIQEDSETLDKVLSKVWEYVHPIEEGRYQYAMTPEFLLFYVFAHMSYHFSIGGCGMRVFIDIWLLCKKVEYDKVIFQELCEESGIWKFAQAVNSLVEVWFEGETHNELTREVEAYVIAGGMYGTSETSIIAKKTQTPKKGMFLLRRLFMPYKKLRLLYPRLKKMPVLYPYYTVVRWCSVLNEDVFNRVTNEVKLNNEIEQKQVDELKNLFDKLGI